MTITSINHGLSFNVAQTDRRLALPVPSGHPVTNRFNDTGSVPLYKALTPPQSAHEGLDWGCPEETEVYAMFDGTVETVHRSNMDALGIYIQIRSSTRSGSTSGFQHTYGHLLYIAANPETEEEEKIGIGKEVRIDTQGRPMRDEHGDFVYSTTELTKDSKVFRGQILAGPEIPALTQRMLISTCMSDPTIVGAILSVLKTALLILSGSTDA